MVINTDLGAPLTADMIEGIIENYGCRLVDFMPCRKVWRLNTDCGYKYLKKTRLSPADLWFIYEALEYLHRNAFENAPRLAWSKKGEPFVKTAAGMFILTEWYFGSELDFRNLMDLKQASRLMAEFHLKGNGFSPSQPNDQRTCWLNWPARLERRLEQLQEFRRLANTEKERSAFSRLFLRHFEPHFRQAVASYLALIKSPYVEVAQGACSQRSFCHHDYSGRNLLRTYKNRIYLIDFDYCLLDLRIHDLINLVVRNLKHNNWHFQICNFILREYQQISKLSQAELEVMYALLLWPQDFWQVGLQYYYEKLPWAPQRFLKKLQHKIAYRFSRNNFLGEFARFCRA